MDVGRSRDNGQCVQTHREKLIVTHLSFVSGVMLSCVLACVSRTGSSKMHATLSHSMLEACRKICREGGCKRRSRLLYDWRWAWDEMVELGGASDESGRGEPPKAFQQAKSGSVHASEGQANKSALPPPSKSI